MATKAASFGGPSPHTSGLFADMTVDGPEIGTLVLVVDRAKNLPNRKTMGKQNPYCAARLGKEAKKSETDKRGGQTPKWDQELRFTVHDSPDYYNIKISIFSEDKRTADLIGEAWVSLKEIVVPGGGKGDMWQGLNYKGKYAGELRIELTYYDSRPKPDQATESVMGMEDMTQSFGIGSSRVKRRPLPSNPNSRHITPATLPELIHPGRAKHGPREYRTPPRANSLPPDTMVYAPQPRYGAPASVEGHPHGSLPSTPMHQAPSSLYYGAYDNDQNELLYEDAAYNASQTPDFLPQLPPSNRQRGSLPPQARVDHGQAQIAPCPRPQSHIGLPHSHSSPAVPSSFHEPGGYKGEYQLETDYPDPIPDVNYQHQHLGLRPRNNDIAPARQNQHDDPYVSRQLYVEQEFEALRPPPPPMHSNSAPVVPHYSPSYGHPISTPPLVNLGTPPDARYHSVPNSSPLQSIERTYATPQRTPIHAPSPRRAPLNTPSPHHPYESDSPNSMPGDMPTPYSTSHLAKRSLPHRHSVADPYQTTPPRQHPLAQEVPRPRSPQPSYARDLPGSSPQPNDHSPYQHDHRSRNTVPMIKPRSLSPQPPAPPQSDSDSRPRSSYSIQHPVRAFESADNSPLSTSQPVSGMARAHAGSLPARKSVTPQATTPTSARGSMPFSPDSFEVHNPNAHQSTLPSGNSPHSPYQIRPGSESVPRDGMTGPIVGFHGQQVDPSDHLPVDSWAPEPEKKVPTKTYGLGREREFGPRTVQSGGGSGGRNLSKDTVVNFRTRSQPLPDQETSPLRNKLQKKTGQGNSPIAEPLRERHNYNSIPVPDPYAQQQYSAGFYQSNDSGYNGYGPLSASPEKSLAHEISNIDIGSGRHGRSGSVPAPTAYIPVRSHKDRRTYY